MTYSRSSCSGLCSNKARLTSFMTMRKRSASGDRFSGPTGRSPASVLRLTMSRDGTAVLPRTEIRGESVISTAAVQGRSKQILTEPIEISSPEFRRVACTAAPFT